MAVLLTACAGRGQSAGALVQEIREDLENAQRIILDARVTADYGDRVYNFTIRYTGDADFGEIAILAPEQIAGVTAEVTIDGMAIVFDGVRLETGPLTSSGLSPAMALPLLISEWHGGRVTFAGFERYGALNTISIETAVDDSVTQRTWFDRRTLLPIRSEISDDGVMVILCLFDNVVIE